MTSPYGKPSKPSVMNALSIDVEDYFHGVAFNDDPSTWPQLTGRVVANTERILTILAEAEVTATFFVLGWVASQYPALVRQIQAAGHEIGSHGYWHRPIYELTPDQFREDLLESKKVIEDIIGCPVRGYRACNFSIVEETIWALDILQTEGFEYDSSIFPTRHDRYGIPSHRRLPYPLSHSFWEFPMSTIEFGSLRLPVGGGGYFRLYPYVFTRWAIRHLNSQGIPVNFYLHPHEIDPDSPLPPNWKNKIRRSLRWGNTELKLIRFLADFGFGPLSNWLSQPVQQRRN